MTWRGVRGRGPTLDRRDAAGGREPSRGWWPGTVATRWWRGGRRELEGEEAQFLENDEWTGWNWVTLDVNQLESSNEFQCSIPVLPNRCTMEL